MILQRYEAPAAADAADAAAWQQAASQLAPLADCCASLEAAIDAGWLAGREQQETLGATTAAAAAALDAVLALQALEATAATAAGGGPRGGGLTVYAHRLCWKAAAKLASLQAQLQAVAPCSSQQEQRWHEQQAALLAAAICSLEQAAHTPALAADYRGLLLQLRCCRLLLPAAMVHKQVAQLALERRQQPDAGAGHGAAALAAWLCAAAWQAYDAANAAVKRRRAGMTAGLVTTCLNPVLFEPAACCGPCDAALHAPDGPLQTLLGRLLPLGGKSWRTMSILSLQVGRAGLWSAAGPMTL